VIAVDARERIEEFSNALKELSFSLEDIGDIDYKCLENTEEFIKCAKRLLELLEIIDKFTRSDYANVPRSAIELLESANREDKVLFTELLKNYRSFIEWYKEHDTFEWRIILEGVKLYEKLNWMDEFREKIIKLNFLYFTKYMVDVYRGVVEEKDRIANYRRLKALDRFNAYLRALGKLAELGEGFLESVTMVLEGRIDPLNEDSVNLWWTMKGEEQCPRIPPYDILPVVDDEKELRKMYSEIYEWYKEYKNLIFMLPGNATPAHFSREFIEKLPSPDKASLHDIYVVAREVYGGILEWGFWGLSKNTRRPLGLLALILKKSLEGKVNPRKSTLYGEGVDKTIRLAKEIEEDRKRFRENPPPACGVLLQWIRKALDIT